MKLSFPVLSYHFKLSVYQYSYSFAKTFNPSCTILFSIFYIYLIISALYNSLNNWKLLIKKHCKLNINNYYHFHCHHYDYKYYCHYRNYYHHHYHLRHLALNSNQLRQTSTKSVKHPYHAYFLFMLTEQ